MLSYNVKIVIVLLEMFDDLRNTDKIRLAIKILEDLGFATDYKENFINYYKGYCTLDPETKKVITIFSKYKHLLFISAKYVELSILGIKKVSVEMLFDIFQYDFDNKVINTIINQKLNMYNYYYSLNLI